MQEKILIIGSSGQIGTELVTALRKIYGENNVIASDIKPSSYEVMNSGPFEKLDIMDEQLLNFIVKKYKVTQVYLLAALLSATAEKNIELGWALNMRSHSHVLDLARHGLIKKYFGPHQLLYLDQPHQKLTHPSIQLWNPIQFMGFQNKLVKDGTNTIGTTSM